MAIHHTLRFGEIPPARHVGHHVRDELDRDDRQRPHRVLVSVARPLEHHEDDAVDDGGVDEGAEHCARCRHLQWPDPRLQKEQARASLQAFYSR